MPSSISLLNPANTGFEQLSFSTDTSHQGSCIVKMVFLENCAMGPSIKEFYRGKTIFITGGTGFMGKVLIEKLLYSCSEFEKIYLLLRTKKGVKPEDRIQQIYKSNCYDRLRKEKPGIFESKISALSGDVSQIGLGLSEEDRALLVNKVNIIFHVAASVRFDDPLKDAVIMNLRGTREVVELAKETKNLKALVHVSTAYSNANRNPIDELIYPAFTDWRDTIKIAETADDETLKTITPKYLGEMPNTYTFTKQLAEHVLNEQKGKLPVVIFRPSIVISSVEEPAPGWVGNFNGPVGLMLAVAKGILKSVYCDTSLASDYMPVDLAIKSLIAAGWERGIREVKSSDDTVVYNCCSGGVNRVTMANLTKIGYELAFEVPLNDPLWRVGTSTTTSPTIHFILAIFLHFLPALLIDAMAILLGKKPMLFKLQKRIYVANKAVGYFMIREWTFKNKNLLTLRGAIRDDEKADFYYEMENVEIRQYFKNCFLGARRYLLNEPDETLPKALAQARRMYFLDIFVKSIFFGLILWWFVNLSIFK